jgi:hypothetical protein
MKIDKKRKGSVERTGPDLACLLGQRRIDVGRASASGCNRGNEPRPNGGSGKQKGIERA